MSETTELQVHRHLLPLSSLVSFLCRETWCLWVPLEASLLHRTACRDLIFFFKCHWHPSWHDPWIFLSFLALRRASMFNNFLLLVYLIIIPTCVNYTLLENYNQFQVSCVSMTYILLVYALSVLDMRPTSRSLLLILPAPLVSPFTKLWIFFNYYCCYISIYTHMHTCILVESV